MKALGGGECPVSVVLSVVLPTSRRTMGTRLNEGGRMLMALTNNELD